MTSSLLYEGSVVHVHDDAADRLHGPQDYSPRPEVLSEFPRKPQFGMTSTERDKLFVVSVYLSVCRSPTSLPTCNPSMLFRGLLVSGLGRRQ
jgi:hypothetical protein